MFMTAVALAVTLQTLPLVVKLGVAPDTSATAPMGYTVSLDGAPPVDVGRPATDPACKDFVGSATGPCVPFSVTITATGPHTVSVVGYNLGGSSPAVVLAFNVTAAPGSGNLRLVK